MVYRNIGTSYLATIDVAEDRDTERGSGDRNDVGGFTYWRQCSMYEPHLGIVGKLDTSVTRHQEGEATT